MKNSISLIITIAYFSFSFGQTKKVYQDPAFWIDLEVKQEGIPVEITSNKGDVKVLIAPVKLLPRNTNKLVLLNIAIDSIYYQAQERGREIVRVIGKIDLSCCRNKPVNLEFIDKDGIVVQYARTNDFGHFKLQSVNGNILEIKNNKIKFNFKKIKIIDINLSERFAVLERKKILSPKKIKRLRKKEKLRIQNY